MAREKLSTAQWVLERQLAWVSNTEVKAGFITTIDIAMLGGLAVAFTACVNRDAWAWLFTGAASLLLFIGVVCAAMTINPRLEGVATKSLLYFGLIDKMTSADYADQFKSATDECLLADWLEQIHVNAKIAMLKHLWAKKAIMFSLASAVPWALAIAFLLK